LNAATVDDGNLVSIGDKLGDCLAASVKNRWIFKGRTT
jgi:hypothetical protein